MFWYTMLGVGIAGVIFAITRQFARPAPKTMNAQYQAMTNEYLKVGIRGCFSSTLSIVFCSRRGVLFVGKEDDADIRGCTEPKNRSHHGYFIRRLPRQGHDTEQTEKGTST